MKGADPIETRAGFAALLDRIEGNGVRTVIVEDASRFARDLITQELGIIALIARGVRVLTASGDDLTDNTDPSRTMMRQIAGAFYQYEKARLVAKLKAARDRKAATGIGRAQGRKTWSEKNPMLVAEAKVLRGTGPRPDRSLREIVAELASQGHVGPSSAPFTGSSIKQMLA